MAMEKIKELCVTYGEQRVKPMVLDLPSPKLLQILNKNLPPSLLQIWNLKFFKNNYYEYTKFIFKNVKREKSLQRFRNV